MTVDWNQVQKELYPLKDYEDACRRFRESFAYAFVRAAYDFSMSETAGYTRRLLGGDQRHRYAEYSNRLTGIFEGLGRAGAGNLVDLAAKVATRDKLAAYAAETGVPASEIAAAMKYLIYWVVPMKKTLGGLVGNDASLNRAVRVMREQGVRTNLDMLEKGRTPSGRKALSEASRLPATVVAELVNRADFSRMPWASKATIANFVGAGYGSLAALAKAKPEQLYADFFRYGESIGKNLKLGNEIESSHRIAKIMPAVVRGTASLQLPPSRPAQ